LHEHFDVAARAALGAMMKALVTRVLIAMFGLTLVTAPVAASAAEFGAGVGVGVSLHAGVQGGWHGGAHDGWHRAPAYGWHGGERGYWRGGYWHAYGGPRFVEGYYGWAPAGYYGYYHAGRWFAHRRWGGGFWIYF
jgi:hypothetical protein